MITLGGNITLAGFSDRDHAELIVVKKLVGRYARAISDKHGEFTNLNVTLKPVHKNAAGNKFEVQARCELKDNAVYADVTERNLFVALDSALKKLVAQL